MRAPMTLFDKRIIPQRMRGYANLNMNDPMYGNGVEEYEYDPIAVKPWKMLTPDERKERIQKYGQPDTQKPDLKKVKVQDVKYERSPIDIQATSPSTSRVQASQQPTKFSYTARDQNGQQKTIYFPDFKSWQEFTDKNQYSHREIENNNQEGHATGYSFQTGGVAMTAEQQYRGLNNHEYDEMYFPNEGYNTFRGLDNGKPVMIQDELGKKLILKGKHQTAKFFGNVYEKRLKRQ